ncbi:Tubby protein-like [Hondaea fermentalgiana]|uniref:Tubby protein-like n=1 Tax=Hondaea fermentalgiana TaxID=2315210 RepID=A0A2R5G7Q8_9STRA|nr:Tubby protein-like [Hondaea fermentalgiana]|eukprot:GBG27086.1 Tubby protein-like [Hondaea fermentalgiana]
MAEGAHALGEVEGMRRDGLSPRALGLGRRGHALTVPFDDEGGRARSASGWGSLLPTTWSEGNEWRAEGLEEGRAQARREARAHSLTSYLGLLGVFTSAMSGVSGDLDGDNDDDEESNLFLSSPVSRRNSWPAGERCETFLGVNEARGPEASPARTPRPQDQPRRGRSWVRRAANSDNGGSSVELSVEIDNDSFNGEAGNDCETPLGSLQSTSSSDSNSAYESVQSAFTSEETASAFEAFSPTASEPCSANTFARVRAKVNPDGTPMTKEEELEAMYNDFAANEPVRPKSTAKSPPNPPGCNDDECASEDAHDDETEFATPVNEGAQDDAGNSHLLEDEDCCFICMAPFSEDDDSERIEMPCVKKCNKSPVHAKCIFEWREHRNNSKEASGTCPLCRGSLDTIKYLPPDPLNRASFAIFEARRQFVMHPVAREHGTIRCFVRVTPSGWLGINTYQMYIQAPCALPYPQGSLPLAQGPVQGDQLLMCARKRMPTLSGNRVDITLDRSGRDYDAKGPNYIAHVHSNLVGLEHTVVQASPGHDKRIGSQELACIVYGQNRIGAAMGPRKMRICIPATEEHEGEEEPDTTAEYRPQRKKDFLASVVQSSTNEELVSNELVRYGENREPSWLESIQAYSLDFYGRVTLPSNKNFQLCLHDDPNENDTCVLQFGKIVSHESNDVAVYTLDFQYPISPIQAFGMAISAADRKLMCA